MPRWVLSCPLCNAEFVHSEIGQTLEEFYLPTKPIFPDEGAELECPNCKETSLFKRHELSYRRDNPQ